MSILELRDISKFFGSSKALDGVSVSVQAGEIHAIAGENGAGKSTLLKIIGGIWPRRSFAGDFQIDGRPAVFYSSRDAQAAGIALIHQELALVPEMTVAENISLGGEMTVFGFVRHRAMAQKATALFDDLGLKIDIWRRVAELGAGERQMVEIAKALSREFGVLVLDEPTASLSELEASKLLEFLVRLKSRGTAIVYVSHRLKEVLKVADRITVLRDGKSVVTWDRAKASEPELIRAMVGRDLGHDFGRSQSRFKGNGSGRGVEALHVDNIRIPGSKREAKRGGFFVHSGEVLGLAGLVGSGRTELLETLFGLRHSPGTKMRVFGESVSFSNPRSAMRHGFGLVSESRKDTGLVVQHAVRPNLTLANLSDYTRAGFVSARAERAAAVLAAKQFSVKCPSIETPAQNLSGGNQQKIVLAKWAARKPRILLLDEPTRGIDVGSKAEIYEWIRAWAAEGMAIVLASSELVEVIGLSDRILVLSDKEFAGEFDAKDATEEKLLHAMTSAFTIRTPF